MQLSGLLNLIERWGGLEGLLETLRGRKATAVALPEGAKPYLLAAIQQRLPVPILVIAARPGRARELQEQIAVWSADPDRVMLFPEPDSLPYERMPGDPTATSARLAAMEALSGSAESSVLSAESHAKGSALSIQHSAPDGRQPASDGQDRPLSTQDSALRTPAPVVVACARAMMELLMTPEELRKSLFRLETGQRIHLQQTLRQWTELGYEAVPVVESPGSFSRRGGILDIYPPGSPTPFRIELFGDEVESIRTFDPATQRSTERVDSMSITPPLEVLPPRAPDLLAKLRDLDLTRCTPQARDRIVRDLDIMSVGDAPPALGFYRPFVGSSTLLDYLPEGGLVVLDDPTQVEAVAEDLVDQAVNLQIQATERGEIPPGLPPALRDWTEQQHALRTKAVGRLEIRYDPDAQELPFAAPPSYGGKLKLVLEEVEKRTGRAEGTESGQDNGHALTLPSPKGRGEDGRSALSTQDSAPIVLLASQQDQRLAELLTERGHPIASQRTITEQPLPGLHLVHGYLSHGWSSDLLGATVLGDSELFGWTKARRATRHRSTPREAFLSDLVEGELAVHVEHGIGRYIGMQRMTSSEGREREYMVLEFADQDRLYVPADQVDRVARYVGSGEESPSLTKLGGSEWTRAKERVRNSVRNIAKDLLAIYSARQAMEGHAFSADTPWQGEMEAAFPYMETPDQLMAIHEVKEDMEAPRPMDRLICGDVGYGKTEVALRAAFKAVMDGKQVAVLVPTTVLAQQHYNGFSERLQPFPANVEVLSRFRSEKEQRKVLEGLAAGTVDICIGTHRLIQKDIHFKDLGLVIVDEEQRFGVMHKERFKQLRQQVDVLTLSATPIPRTLHMSLTGIRDMSTMETPPEERLPIRTFVAEYTDSMVKEAILREIDRGGQVYFVHNRVHNIKYIAAQIQKLVPEARVAIGHGQMPEEQLEKVMLEFQDGEYDILVCTTIIESGLDIPNVNTIVINQADRFGLAQLYQLRGRVGRGANRAYAYFLYDKNRQLNEIAEKRLKTIFENTELGSGFRIAMKDLEIRGAGNLLGVEQHGQVNAVGFDLYTRLLSEAVSELQGKPVDTPPDVTLDLPLAASLPQDYVTDEAARLSLYQRLAGVRSEEGLGALLEEVQDRFGALPAEAQDLFYMVNLKVAAGKVGIKAISRVGTEILLKLEGIPIPIRNRLLRKYGAKLRVMPNQIRLRMSPGTTWMTTLQEVVDDLRQAAEAIPAMAARS